MSQRQPTVDELFEDGRAIDEALREAARDARRLHKAFGRPMATWQNGQAVWIQPEEIQIDVPEQEPDRPVDLVRGILTRRVSTDRAIDEMRGPGPASAKRRK